MNKHTDEVGKDKPQFIIPSHISREMREWILDLLAEWDFPPETLKVIVMAAEAKDRYESARITLSKKGVTYQDRFDAPRARPEVAIERDSRIAFLRCLAVLGLDEEPESEPEGKRPYTNFRKTPEWVLRLREQESQQKE